MTKTVFRFPAAALLAVSTLLAASCADSAPDLAPGPVLPAPPGVFTEDGPEAGFALRTSTVSVEGKARTHSYHFRVPAGYNADKTRSYPLVVSLHPWGPSNKAADLKDGSPYAGAEVQALPESADHPAFVYVPVCPPPYGQDNSPPAPRGGEWNSPAARAMVLDTIRDLQNRFHVDPSRIYLVGFSMGGSGSWYLAHEYHRVTGLRFAALVRGAGWYLTDTPENQELFASVSLVPSWIHVGAEDTSGEAASDPLRVARGNYALFRDRYASSEDPVETWTAGGRLTGDDGLSAEVSRLVLKSGAELRLSVYRGKGHEDLMWRSRGLLDWLFAQHR